MVNKLLNMLLLRAPMCRASVDSVFQCFSVGRRFREDKAVQSSYSKMRIMPYCVMFNRHVVTSQHVWAPGLISAFSAYIVTPCL